MEYPFWCCRRFLVSWMDDGKATLMLLLLAMAGK